MNFIAFSLNVSVIFEIRTIFVAKKNSEILFICSRCQLSLFSYFLNFLNACSSLRIIWLLKTNVLSGKIISFTCLPMLLNIFDEPENCRHSNLIFFCFILYCIDIMQSTERHLAPSGRQVINVSPNRIKKATFSFIKTRGHLCHKFNADVSSGSS